MSRRLARRPRAREAIRNVRTRLRTIASLAALTLCSAVCASSCLPADTRPVPAMLHVTVTGGALVKNGIPATSDGWSVTFDRFLITLGQARLGGDPCTPYSDGDYKRIFDAKVADGQKLSDLYATGTCDFTVRISNPDADSILSPGVTIDDQDLMRTPSMDRYSEGQTTGVSLYVKGSASKAGVVKRFAWSFRSRRVELHDCARFGEKPTPLVLQGGTSPVLDVQIRGEALFQDGLDPSTAKLRFTPFADADDITGNADGEVTLDELRAVPVDAAGSADGDIIRGDGGTPSFATFEDYVYLGLSPQIGRLGTEGACIGTLGKPRRED